MHSSGVHHILNRKAITREVLFKYLHEKRVQVCENYTKLLLIERIIEYWNGNKPLPEKPRDVVVEAALNADKFPINLMSKEFSEWFFKNFNENGLKSADFWLDCSTNVRIVAAADKSDINAEGNEKTLEILRHLQGSLGVVFNPNLCYEGVQGRIDPHGLVVLMCCGTVHKEAQIVGVFETAFGLVRDPYNENNWRIKHLKMQMKSTAYGTNPKLTDCETLQSILALPESREVV